MNHHDRFLFTLILAVTTFFGPAAAQDLYYPPTDNTASWETLSPDSLGWCADEIEALFDYLDEQETKGFIVLKDGRIVLEKYFGTFVQDSLWYWASAGKTITAFLAGKAHEEGHLSIEDPVSDYLGTGWTDCPDTSESDILVRHQLTMTTGLEDGITDNHCTLDTCLLCLAPAGTRWAYHNAPYTLLDKVLATATGQPMNAYTQTRLKAQTGMRGLWLPIGYDNVFFSDARSMARFGLLAQHEFVWDNTPLLQDTLLRQQLTQTSQDLNLSYGYLWWLNGQASFMLPTLPFVFPGFLFPAAPADMFAALGKNGQILSVSRQEGLVVVRMGNQPDGNPVPTQLCNSIWERLGTLACNATSTSPPDSGDDGILLYPNPAQTAITITLPPNQSADILISNAQGTVVIKADRSSPIDISGLEKGLYLVTITLDGMPTTRKLVKY